MSAYPPHALPWWQLSTVTAAGARTMDCWHRAGDTHRAAHVRGAVVTCSSCGTPRASGLVWATLDRVTVLCGRCHEAAHDRAAAAADTVPAASGELDGQLDLTDLL